MGHGDTYESAQFRRLGYLSLNSNERSKYQARELKSVYVNAPGQYMRMVVHKCYINEINLFNQVGCIWCGGLPIDPSRGFEMNASAHHGVKPFCVSLTVPPVVWLNTLDFFLHQYSCEWYIIKLA